MKIHHHHEHHSGHEHSNHDHGGHGASSKPLKWVLLLTVLYFFVEVIAGFIANSLALLGDALHMFTDAGGLSISLVAFWLSKLPANSRMTWGYQRAEMLGALLSGLLIWAMAGILVFEGIERIQNPRIVDGPLVSGVALVGLIVNLISARILHGSQEHHMSFKSAYLHVLTDIIGSLGALASGLIIWKTGWLLADPLVTFFCVTIVLFSSWRLVTEAFDGLMGSVPKAIKTEKVLSALRGISGVEGVHDLHVWAVSKNKTALSVHLQTSREPQSVLSQSHELLHSQFNIHHTTVQIENPKEFKSDCCFGCDPAELKVMHEPDCKQH